MTDRPKDLMGLLSAPPRTSARVMGPPARARAARVEDGSDEDASVTVSQFAARMKGSLEDLGDVAVRGEISGFKVISGGHWTFDLKDAGAKIPVIVFFNQARRATDMPREGEAVVVTGNASFQTSWGKAQFIGKLVVPRGEGALARKLEELKKRLQNEGLFDVEKKRPLPLLPVTVGIVTSLKGAAVRDVLTVMRDRAPNTAVVIKDTRVQGDGAAADIAAAIRDLDAYGKCDVILVVRGGGAREDLHAFNTEPVVRAIAGCRVPVVAGVGHEVDVTLADLAADVRAATPSQAAELTVPRHDDLARRIAHLENRLRSQTRAALDRSRRHLHELSARLPSPAAMTQTQQRRLQRLDERLAAASPQAQLSTRARAIDALQQRLSRQDPRADVAAARAALDAASVRLDDAVAVAFDDANFRLQRALEQLDALSPTAVLRRGFALVTVADGARDGAIATAADLAPGRRLRVRVVGGDARVTVDRDDDQHPPKKKQEPQ